MIGTASSISVGNDIAAAAEGSLTAFVKANLG